MGKEERDAEMQRAMDFRLSKSQLKKNTGKATYAKGNIFGGEQRYEGKVAQRASKRDKGRWS